MTRIAWSQVGSRRYEAGCDRGVLYLPSGDAVPWNGLTSVTETAAGAEIEDYYLDGVKYLSRRKPTEYSGKMTALTYPDEFMVFDGIAEFDSGLAGTNQPVVGTFGLSYRTMLGNDTAGTAFGYRIHLLYNLTAIPDDRAYKAMGSATEPEEFTWTLSGVPIQIQDLRPTVHVIVDSTRTAPGNLAVFENYLYGTDVNSGMLPTPDMLVAMQVDVITDPIAALI